MAIVRLIDTVLTKPDVLTKIPGAMVTATRKTQRVQNPFERPKDFTVANLTIPSSECGQFARGWYSGYLVGYLALELLGGKGASTVSRGETLTDASKALALSSR